MTLAFEDFQPGHFGTYGPRHVTREEIIAFASEYDPQPMHLDDEAANASMLNGLAGSGWHMCSIMMRMIVDGFLLNTLCRGSPGCNEMRWLAPLRPGDDLTLDVAVMEARPSQSRPATGVVTYRCSVRDASGLMLGDMVLPVIIGRRESVANEAGHHAVS